jgi:hypothetical protein
MAMLRWLLLGLLYGLGTALRHGWLEVQWHRLLHDAGLTFVDPDEPIELHELPLFKPTPAPKRPSTLKQPTP